MSDLNKGVSISEIAKNIMSLRFKVKDKRPSYSKERVSARRTIEYMRDMAKADEHIGNGVNMLETPKSISDRAHASYETKKRFNW